jgi:hypothetical protein
MHGDEDPQLFQIGRIFFLPFQKPEEKKSLTYRHEKNLLICIVSVYSFIVSDGKRGIQEKKSKIALPFSAAAAK